MEKIKIGIAGCGDIAFRSYLPAIANLGEQVELAAVCDLDSERLRQVQEEYGVSQVFSDAEEMLAESDIDGVMVLTPMVPHGPISVAALEAGKHVYVEKVMAVDLSDADRMIALADAKGVILACAPSTILLSAFQRVKELLDANVIGHVSLVQALGAHMGPARWDDFSGDPTWFYQPGAGPLFDLAVYPVQILTHLFGPARRVTAFSGLAVPEVTMTAKNVRGKTVQVNVDDTVPFILDFGAARFATINTSYNMLASRQPAMQFFGDRGSVTAPQFLGNEVGVWRTGDPDWDIVQLPRTLYDELHVAAGLPHWLDCIRDGKQPVNNARHARHVLEILLGALESAKTGQAVELKSTF